MIPCVGPDLIWRRTYRAQVQDADSPVGAGWTHGYDESLVPCEDDLVLVNPEIVDRSGPVTLHEEGCLSFPSIYAEVRRPERCTVVAVDAAGTPLEATYEGFTSRIVQHEFDHLEGVLLVDRMSPADKLRNRPFLEELVEAYQASRADG